MHVRRRFPDAATESSNLIIVWNGDPVSGYQTILNSEGSIIKNTRFPESRFCFYNSKLLNLVELILSGNSFLCIFACYPV